VVGGLTLGTGKYIEGTGVVVGGEAVFDLISASASITPASIVNALPTTTEEAAAIERGITAVKDLELNTTTPPWYGYNLTIYVYGTLTVKGSPTVPGPASVVAIGEVLIDGSVAAVTTLGDADKVAVSNAILKNTAAATVQLPDEITLRGIDTGAATLTIAGAATSLAIGDLNGDVELPTALTAVRVSGGTGNVTTAATSITGEVSFGNNGTISFTDTTTGATFGGTASFAGAATFSGDAEFTGAADFIKAASFEGKAEFTDTADFGNNATFSDEAEFGAAATFNGEVKFTGTATFATTASFARTVVFGDDVTLTAGAATFRDDAFFADDKKITLAAATSSIITLKPGAALAVGEPTPSVPPVYYEVIGNKAAAGDLKLTPTVNNTVLTFGSGGSIKQSGGATANGITITGIAGLTAGATYTVESADATNAGTLKIDVNSTLELADGLLLATAEERELGASELKLDANSSLVLAGSLGTLGATISGAGEVKAGATTITGAWQAVTAAGETPADITIKATAAKTAEASITGAANNALTAGTGGTITQRAVADNNLTIGAVTTIALGGTSATEPVGKIKLTQDGTNPGKLTLAAATSIIFTLADKTPGTNYSSAISTIGGFTPGAGITKTEVFQAGNKLTKLIGASTNATLTANTTGTGTDDIDSTTATTGS
jgi:hypothetical protein